MASEAEERLVDYLNQTYLKSEWSRRVTCCNASRSLYCPECCTVLVPEEEFPEAIRDARFQFPFDLDIVLDVKERKTSSTGIQLVALANALESCRSKLPSNAEQSKATSSVVLYDMNVTKLPKYDPNDPGVYVLFPASDSVPISSVCPKKLVVLDIKWSRQKMKTDPDIAALPKVHLDSPPAQSHFWRWHSAGDGMLSTAEAVYFAAMEVTRHSLSREQRDDLVHMMWLFAVQRVVISGKSELEQRVQPFSNEGKQVYRAQRTQQKGNPPKKKSAKAGFYESLSN